MRYLIFGPTGKNQEYIVSREQKRRRVGRTLTKPSYKSAYASAVAMRTRDGRKNTRIRYFDCRLPC